jgi:hypothetical protein
MIRRTRKNALVKNGALRESRLNDAVNKCAMLMHRLQTIIEEPQVTNNDLLLMFVKPEHRHTVTEIMEIARCPHVTSYFEHPMREHGAGITFYQRDPELFIIPKYAGEFWTGERPELMDKIVEWVGQTKELGTQITLAKHAIEELNEKCKTPQQMRFFLDSFNVLTGMNLEFKVPRDIPSLHPELKRVLREVDVLVAKALLVKEEAKTVSRMHVDIRTHTILPWAI